MTVAIHQPNFMPWMGFFNKIYKADVFVLIDKVQYTKGNVCNRNKIKNNSGEPVWLTVPVNLEKGMSSTFHEVTIKDINWHKKACAQIREYYGKAPFFDQYFPEIEMLLSSQYDSLATLNITLIRFLCQKLNITTPIYLQSETGVDFGKKNLLVLGITKHFEGSVYLSGQGAKKYNDHALFHDNGIEIIYQQYDAPKYQQINNGFVERLSIIDLLFNVGEESRRYVCIP